MVALTRRKALAALAGTGALGIAAALPQCTRAALASEADPIFAEIERHRQARDRLNSLRGDEPEWDAADLAEREAWEAFAETHPTTSAGLAAMTAYVLHSPAFWETEENGTNALRTIATVTAHFAAKAGTI